MNNIEWNNIICVIAFLSVCMPILEFISNKKKLSWKNKTTILIAVLMLFCGIMANWANKVEKLQSEELQRKQIDNVRVTMQSNFNTVLNKLDSNLKKYGYKLDGSSVIKIQSTVNNNLYNIHVKSENQNGGQTANNITNNN